MLRDSSQRRNRLLKRVISFALSGILVTPFAWTQIARSEVDGKKIFEDKCVSCHGEKGEGNGPMSKNYSPKPQSFHDPKFWQGDLNKKITEAIKKGKDQMDPVDLKPEEIKAVIDYITKTFK